MIARASSSMLLGVLLYVATALACENCDIDRMPARLQERTSSDEKPPPAAAGDNQDQNKDLDKIPGSVQQPAALDVDPAPAASGANQRIYVENAVILSAQRGGLTVPFPLPAASKWQERLFLDVRKEW